MEPHLKVLIVDDHPMLRAGCRELLENGLGATVIEAGDGEQGYHLFVEQKPALVIIDITLPGISGFEILERMRAMDPQAKILIFSMHEEPMFAARAIKAGAQGFVTKSRPPEELVEAVREVAQGNIYISRPIAQQLALARFVGAADPLEALSQRELEILKLLGEGRGLGEIASSLHVSYKTVANRVMELKLKFGVKTNAQLIRIALQRGLSSS